MVEEKCTEHALEYNRYRIALLIPCKIEAGMIVKVIHDYRDALPGQELISTLKSRRTLRQTTRGKQVQTSVLKHARARETLSDGCWRISVLTCRYYQMAMTLMMQIARCD